jgi:hypothetical protein
MSWEAVVHVQSRKAQRSLQSSNGDFRTPSSPEDYFLWCFFIHGDFKMRLFGLIAYLLGLAFLIPVVSRFLQAAPAKVPTEDSLAQVNQDEAIYAGGSRDLGTVLRRSTLLHLPRIRSFCALTGNATPTASFFKAPFIKNSLVQNGYAGLERRRRRIC